MTHYTGAVPATGREERWRDEAACAGVDPDLFFTDNSRLVQTAKQICLGCPVRLQCNEYAITNGENWGVWGGMTQTQLRTRRTRRRAKPAA
ncbi:WhiB family transcriptional regulator [Streptomyces lavendulae]|nr:WhiB family transcriptional regulator [Streptomyces lavendulae]TXJ78577.1 WhiB family transcriptional regulator [Streptomyces lavendulae]